ncbi:putative membrane protein [Saccharopolyspora lacisalsi]|uniref:Putative membrane protein n=1 Tax=Halosaccharopolyspora lacisalsi TaxID=1000566 RepID=A0A839DPX2_9PSEU|nr:PH domain-containing protein [Halosaccharopolyspora lacisalsi]MBA8823113.1 putative membrane protein [Halosaccharopolyspora lacisalsi]
MSGSDGDERWQRLDPKSVLAVGVLALAPLIPTGALMTLTGAKVAAVLSMVGIWVGIAVLVSAATAVSWYFTRYRITARRFELRAGNLSRSHRSIPRDRVRSVDLTSQPVHRLLGLSVVKIGTGQQSGADSEIKLDAVTTSRAAALRRELLRGAGQAPAAEPAEDEIARIRPAWFGYSALTASFVLVVWGALVSGISSLSELVKKLGLLDAATERFVSLPLWVGIGTVLLGMLLIGMAGSVALSVEMWWAFRLTREPGTDSERGDTLRVRRGLLTTRSVSLEERRLRGAELAEPLLLRWVGGARVNAVATGLSTGQESKQPARKTLLPPAPRAEAHRVSAAVLRERGSLADVALRRHPRAALRRRLIWSLAISCPIVAASAALALPGVPGPSWAWVVAVIALPAAGTCAVDAYRNLGHGIAGDYLIARCGTGVRNTVALRRDGVIGWRVKQSLFQRRAGLVTLSATTSAGHGVYAIRDVATGEGLTFAEEAVPELLRPFLEEAPRG